MKEIRFGKWIGRHFKQMKSKSDCKERVISQNRNILGSREIGCDCLMRISVDGAGYLGHSPIAEGTYFQRGCSQFNGN